MKKQIQIILKSVGFMLFVRIIAMVCAFISWGFSDEQRMVTLICLSAIMVCLIPTYFLVKGKTPRPWFYLIVTAVSYIIITIISFVILRASLSLDGENAFYAMNAEIYLFIIEAIVGIYFIVIALLDSAIIICQGIVNYVKTHKVIIISFIAGALTALIAVSVVFTVSSINSFDNNICTIIPPSINYIKDGRYVESCEDGLDPNFVMPLTTKESMHFGKVDKGEYIRIGVKDVADIYIYRHNDESVIVEYNPRNFGFTQRYVAHKNFEYYMQQLYKQTGEEGFNVYPEE